MNEETLKLAYQWFRENGYEVDVDIENLCLYVAVWDSNLDNSADKLQLSTTEIEYRAELYKNSNK